MYGYCTSVHLYVYVKYQAREQRRWCSWTADLIICFMLRGLNPAFCNPPPPSPQPLPRQLANKDLVRSANKRPVGQDGEIWLAWAFGALVESCIWQCAAGAEFCTSNAVGYRRIHHQFTRLGKAYYSCETVHGFWVRARVAGGTFLSGILLGLNTV
jgi:hypothetical protein